MISLANYSWTVHQREKKGWKATMSCPLRKLGNGKTKVKMADVWHMKHKRRRLFCSTKSDFVRVEGRETLCSERTRKRKAKRKLTIIVRSSVLKKKKDRGDWVDCFLAPFPDFYRKRPWRPEDHLCKLFFIEVSKERHEKCDRAPPVSLRPWAPYSRDCGDCPSHCVSDVENSHFGFYRWESRSTERFRQPFWSKSISTWNCDCLRYYYSSQATFSRSFISQKRDP